MKFYGFKHYSNLNGIERATITIKTGFWPFSKRKEVLVYRDEGVYWKEAGTGDYLPSHISMYCNNRAAMCNWSELSRDE